MNKESLDIMVLEMINFQTHQLKLLPITTFFAAHNGISKIKNQYLRKLFPSTKQKNVCLMNLLDFSFVIGI
jgi:hypothetical protein